MVADALVDGDRIAVTGASGWFGATAMDQLHDCIGPPAAESVVGYGRSARAIRLPSGRTVQVKALDSLAGDQPASVLLHFGYLTRDRVADLGVDAYVAQNLQISATVLAAVRSHRPRLFVTASSGAVYTAARDLEVSLRQNPYGALKVIDELAFAKAATDAGAGWAIPRVFSVAGPGMTKRALYALGSMIDMARAGGPVVVRADRPVVRSYCGVDEVVALSMWAAGQHADCVFDTCGNPVEMGDLAALVADRVGSGCEVRRTRYDAEAAPDRYVGHPSEMEALSRRANLRLRELGELITATAQDGS